MTEASAVYVPPDVQSIMGVIDTHLRWLNKTEQTRQFLQYHPSAFGKCLRSMQYSRYVAQGLFTVEEEDLESQSIRLFEKGHNMHRRWSSYFESIGILRGIWQCSNPCCRLWSDDGQCHSHVEGKSNSFEMPRVYGKDDNLGVFRPELCVCGSNNFDYHEITVSSEDLNMYGHIDGILDFSRFDAKKYEGVVKTAFNLEKLPKTPIVFDMKTMNDYRWKQGLMRTGPGIEYRIQLCIYMHLLNLEYGLLIYENKNTSEAKAFKITKEETKDMFSQIAKQAKMMKSMAECSPVKLPPPRLAAKDDYECSHCKFRKLCHASTVWDDDSKLNTQRKQFYGSLIE